MEASNLPLVELLDKWGIANAERMMVRADQLQLSALLSRKGNSGEVWRGTLWGKQVRRRGLSSGARPFLRAMFCRLPRRPACCLSRL
jgi:hypothetical protein